MPDQLGGDPAAGERRQHPDVCHGGVADGRPAGQGQSAGDGVGGADELLVDERTDGAPGFEQREDLAGLQI
ncbi:Uncharacterised protein [Mycobacterium tuberculosis]|nr:Uncharacterised protein [Mycobacterium tuberculosis]